MSITINSSLHVKMIIKQKLFFRFFEQLIFRKKVQTDFKCKEAVQMELTFVDHDKELLKSLTSSLPEIYNLYKKCNLIMSDSVKRCPSLALAFLIILIIDTTTKGHQVYNKRSG